LIENLCPHGAHAHLATLLALKWSIGTAAQVAAVVDDIYSFLKMDPEDESSWYAYEPGMTRVLG
jgi:hypothetical protein